ncbi:MAG: hypothetical protein L6R41_003546 [Letrouitia leprolyta]|nr:MAG: hypothetical protein L6R41_003546 [Letrouitia leprolyta]
MATDTFPNQEIPTSPMAIDLPPLNIKPEFFVSTYTASQFYQPPPPKWFMMKTAILRNFEKPTKEALEALETLADIRAKLDGYHDMEQIDLLIDHKINVIAQFTPRNAFDYPEESQLERLARLTEVRRKLAATDFGLASIDDVLKKSVENLILATGIARSHSFLTAHLPILSFRAPSLTLTTTSPRHPLSIFFDDRTRLLRLCRSGTPYLDHQNHEHEVTLSLRDIWKATWAEHSAKICLHVFAVFGAGTREERSGTGGMRGMRYESFLIEMKGTGDAKGFLQKMSGVANFRLVRVESEEMGKLFARGPRSYEMPE